MLLTAITEERLFQGTTGNIPDLPSIIVVPKPLHPQFTRELRRYLVPQSFDILPYTGRVTSRADFWTSVWMKSVHQEGRKILIATVGVSLTAYHSMVLHSLNNLCQAIEDDAGHAVQIDKSRPSTMLEIFSTAAQGATVYSKHWMVFALDEAHKIRTQNAAFTATAALRRQSLFLVAVTATPITTSAKVSIYKMSYVNFMFITRKTGYI